MLKLLKGINTKMSADRLLTMRAMAPELPDYNRDIRSALGGIVLQSNEGKHNISAPLRQGAALVFDRTNAQHPEIAAMTGFGSAARGEAVRKADGSSSDLDGTIFVDTDIKPVLEGFTRTNNKGEVVFRGIVDGDIRDPFARTLNELTGLSTDHDISVRPVSQAIIEQEAARLTRTASKLIETGQGLDALGDFKDYPVRTTLALFASDISSPHSLNGYRRRLLSEIQKGSNGNKQVEGTAWQMVRRGVVGFEAGKGKEDVTELTHREVPKTYEEAVEFYSVKPQIAEEPVRS